MVDPVMPERPAASGADGRGEGEPTSARDAIEAIWREHALDASALDALDLDGEEPALPSSFAVGTAAQASLALAALAAATIGRVRNGVEQRVGVDMRHAAYECSAYFQLDGRTPQAWDPIAGLYPCADGFVRLHTNFAHHRDGTLRLLGLPPGDRATRDQVRDALAAWRAVDFEDAIAEAGLVGVAVRTREAWLAQAQAAAVASLPLVEIERIGDASPLAWPDLEASTPPLTGLRVLDLTRILAGPAAGRTLAAYGADVMLVNSPNLPNIDAIADLSRGKRSALCDLRDPAGRDAFARVLGDAHVLLQSYRPGGLDALGIGAEAAARARPGIVYASLSAWGRLGPWRDRRGFDSLVQAATGINVDEGEAAGAAEPKALPVQLLDMASGFLLAFGIERALLRQRVEGGSWHVQVSLARTGQWLRKLGRLGDGFAAPKPDLASVLETTPSGFGELTAIRHAARFSATPARYARRSERPGHDPLAW